jgi:PAS domain S-box-containing protein
MSETTMSETEHIPGNNYIFLSGGGEMGELIRSVDWSKTPIGEPSTWPECLRTSISLVLNSYFPMYIAWGSEYIQLYNDGYRPILGASKHPQAVGISTKETFSEIWHIIGSMFDSVMKGQAVGFPNFMLPLDRNGFVEECFFDFCYSPIKQEDGTVGGVLVTVVETTETVRSIKELEISKQKTADAKIEAERQRDRLNQFFMQAPAGVCILDGPDLKFELVNPLYQQLFPGRALMGKPLLDALPEIKGQPIWDALLGVYTTGKTFEGNELLIPLARTDNGPVEDRYFNFIYQAKVNEHVQPDGILAFVIEVTDMVMVRKQAEQSELRLRMAIKSTNLGTWDYNPITGELHWSAECRNIYGIPADQSATIEAFSEHIYPDDREWVQKEIQKSLLQENGGQYDLSYRIIRFDNGETRWIKVQGNVTFENGKASRFIGTVLDITEMKFAEEKSAKLAAIIASSDDAIISKTLESVITSWNDSAQRMFGYAAEEMIGETIYKLIPNDRQEEEPLILGRLRSGERVEHFETKRLTKEGKLLDVSVSVSPVKDSKGNIIGLSKIARDITERKMDETRKNDFIGMVSHELKTPLTSLSAILQVAGAKLKNSDDSFLAGAMHKANVQVKRMTAMINGFLNVSRLESAKILIEKQRFQLEALIAEVIEEISLTVSTHVIHFSHCQLKAVNADRDKISSVISNLIGNAIKYSPNGTNIEISCATDNQNVVVSVKDEGIGIKPQDAKMIFDRYYRVESTDTKNISGFGIGLYVSAEIIRRHGGDIWVESEKGKGSVFHFSLPLEA